MRKTARAIALLVLALLSAVVLGVASAFTAAITFAATALLVPGTGTPVAGDVTNYMENARERFIAPFNPPCDPTCDLEGIDYPASFFPLVIFPGWCEPGRCETWNDSVGQGVATLHTTLQNLPDDAGPTYLFGYSQGGQVVANELRALANDPDLLAKVSGVVVIGSIANPDGGLFTRLGFLPTIPLLDVTFGPAMPTDLGVPITTIGFEYDPVVYAPLYWGNPLAMLNALAAFDNVHGFYLTPNGNAPDATLAYGYTPEELAEVLATPCPGAHCRVDQNGNDYYMIPAKSLPLANLILGLADSTGTTPLVKPVVDLFSPVARVLIDLGYDWSGDPGVPRTLSILPFNPFQNWVEVGVDLAEAVVEGINAAVGGGTTMIAPAPAPVTTVSALSAANEADSPQTADTPAPADTSTPATELVSESDESTPAPEPEEAPEVDETDAPKSDPDAEDEAPVGDTSTEAENEAPSTVDEEPTTKPEETADDEEDAEKKDAEKKDDDKKPSTTEKDDDKKDAEKKDSDKKDSDKKANDKKEAA